MEEDGEASPYDQHQTCLRTGLYSGMAESAEWSVSLLSVGVPLETSTDEIGPVINQTQF